ncbi:unnamed protein product [Closterium sp. NIES-53]
MLLPFYLLVYVDDLVFATADTEALTLVKSELQKRHTCTDLGPSALRLPVLLATAHSSVYWALALSSTFGQGYTFSLGSGSVSWRSTHSSLVLSSSCEAEIYAGAMAAEELRRLTYLLTDLGEQPRSAACTRRSGCATHLASLGRLLQVLQHFGFLFSSPQSTPLPSGHSLSSHLLMSPILARYVAPGRHRPEHWEAAKRVLRYLCSTSVMGLVLGGQGPFVLTRYADASLVDDLATQQSSQGSTFSIGSGSVSWQSTHSSSVLSSSCEAEIYAGAMAAQELRWPTYLLADLGERPRSPPVLYVDNKAMIALCQEHRLEHRTKHIAQRYFLARELQQRGQLRLVYVATRANSADIFTKALQSGDHQRFCTVLACFAFLDWSVSKLL